MFYQLFTMVIILCSMSASTLAAPPDILFIAIDDMNDWTTLFDDSNPIQTPNLKRLASRGAFFTKAYCAAPGCNPSRTAILTGLRPSTSGVYGNRDAWKQIIPNVVTLPQYFTQSGYATKGAGKIFHHGKTGADREDNPSFQDFYPLQLHANAPPQNYNGYVKGRDSKQLASASWDWGQHDVAKQTDEYMVEHVNKIMATHPKDKPLFLAAGIFRPHLPFWAPPATFKRYPFNKVALPPMPKNDLDDVPAIGQAMAHTEYFIWENTTKKPAKSPGSLKSMVQSYQASADYADQMVGRLLDQLDATGRAKNTIVVLWADHGYHLGDKEACVKFTLWEKANHVPFIIVAPGVTTPGSRITRPVSLVDIYPTLIELAGLPAKAELDGQSLVPLLKNPNTKWDRPALMTQLRGNHAIRTDRYRYIHYNDGTEELYDHQNDHWEHNNLAGDKKYAAIIKQHKQWLPKNEAVTPQGTQRSDLKKRAAASAAKSAIQSNTQPAAFAAPAPQKKTPRPAARSSKEIVIADFESNSYNGWTTTGEAFSNKPAIAGVTHKNKFTGHRGQGLVNSFYKADTTTGTLTSPPFTLNRKYLNFLIGGGRHPGKTCVNLLIDNKIIYTATGFSTKNAQGQAVHQPVAWDVSKYTGQKARIQIVDNITGGWGHITADHFVLANIPSAEPPLHKDIPLATTLNVSDTHLIIPVKNPGAPSQILGIYDGDELIQNFKVALPQAGQPFWNAAYPLAHFNLKGKTITIKPIDGVSLPDTYRMAFNLMRIGDDNPLAAPNDYTPPYRNQFHLTSRRGWNNDPNGMVYHNGQYHLYYQHNPFGITWGNMHWGHFVSKDLIIWREDPIALYQKTVKDMAFSGGGFVDFNNSAGYGKNTLFVAFTSTGRGECLAYSLDDGQTFTELPENPVVKHSGRDPKIIWHAPSKKWIMVVYNNDASPDVAAVPLADPKTKRKNANIDFYTSTNLHQWTHASSFTDPDRDAVFECPEFFNLPIEGQPGQSRWILYGAQNRYFVGHFDGAKFTKESGPHGDSHGNFYAAQTFSDTPDARRIQIGWVRGGNTFTQQYPSQITSQGFTLPHTMTLRQTPVGLRIFFNPVVETQNLRTKTLANATNLTLKQANTLLQKCNNQLTEVVIEYKTPGPKILRINGIDASFDGTHAQIFTDRTINEIYIDSGASYQVHTRPQADFAATESTTDPSNGPIKSLKIFQLKSIW